MGTDGACGLLFCAAKRSGAVVVFVDANLGVGIVYGVPVHIAELEPGEGELVRGAVFGLGGRFVSRCRSSRVAAASLERHREEGNRPFLLRG